MQEQPFEESKTVDEDGEIQAKGANPPKPPGRMKGMMRAQMMEHALAGAQATLLRITQTIVDIDVTIGAYSDLLAKAQPLNSGRVVIVFGRSHRVKINGIEKYDVVPMPMRMVQYVSGSWHVRRPGAYTKLEELRVGKGLPSDRLVVQILRELDKLFAGRERLVAYLTDFRKPAYPAIRSVDSKAVVSMKRLPLLQSRLKLDWQEDAKGCREAIRAERKARNEARRQAMMRSDGLSPLS